MLKTTLCYVYQGEKVLMVYRNKKKNDFHEGKWNGLGGKFEASETALECVRREVYEESGLTILNPKLIGVCFFPNFDTDDEWMKVRFTDKKNNQITKLLRIENIDEIEILRTELK